MITDKARFKFMVLAFIFYLSHQYIVPFILFWFSYFKLIEYFNIAYISPLLAYYKYIFLIILVAGLMLIVYTVTSQFTFK